MTARRFAEIERAYALVDLGVVFALAAWIPQGFRPWWLPLLGALGGWGAAALWRLAGRAFDRRVPGGPRGGPSLRWTAQAVEIRMDAARVTRVPWSAVRAAFAFRRETGDASAVVLAFVSHDGRTLECDDRLQGWVDLASDLPGHLAGCEPLESWFIDVVRQAPAPYARRLFGDVDGFVATPRPAPGPAAMRPGVAMRTFLAHGTLAILIAAAVLLLVAALVRGETELGSLGFAILAYAALSRLAVWFAVGRAQVRTVTTRRRP